MNLFRIQTVLISEIDFRCTKKGGVDMNQLTEQLSAYYGPLERFVKFRINNLQDAEDIV